MNAIRKRQSGEGMKSDIYRFPAVFHVELVSETLRQRESLRFIVIKEMMIYDRLFICVFISFHVMSQMVNKNS